ncbi:MAG: solute carrier family 26 protein [Bacteroidia bacterium]|nr:solute carrier family 26 protein [Bacteroidia bacterium]
MNIKQFIPILQWLPKYGKSELKGDLFAGLTVGVMLIPQGMAYAMLAGMPPIYGLYASIIPLIIFAIFGTSRQLSVGPFAMVSLLVAAGVSTLAAPESAEYLQLAILLAFMVGVMQFALGAFRLGFLVNFLSRPVISGFTSAAALIIAFSQLKHLLGVEIPRSQNVLEIGLKAIEQAGQLHWLTLGTGLAGIAFLLGLKKIKKSLPAALFIVILGIAAVWLFKLESTGIKIVGKVPDGLPHFETPALQWASIKALFPIALAISLIGFMQSYAISKTIQQKHPEYKLDPNQELIGLGLANLAGSFFKAFPVAGGLSRSAVNDQSGAKTGMASVFSATLVALTLLFLTPVFYYLPNSILAAIIMVSVLSMLDVRMARELWKSDKTDFIMLVVTFLVTLAFGIEWGIGAGVVLSLVMVLYRSAYPHVAELALIRGTHHYRNVERYPDQIEQRDDLLIVRFDSRLFFANAGFFQEKIEQLEGERGDKLKLVVLNAEAIPGIDSTGAFTLKEVIQGYQARGIRFVIARANGPVRDGLFRSGLISILGKDNLFLRVNDAVEDFDQKLRDESAENPDLHEHALQTNFRRHRK